MRGAVRPRDAVSLALGLGLVPACCAVLAFSPALAARGPSQSAAGDPVPGLRLAARGQPVLSTDTVLGRDQVLDRDPVLGRDPVLSRDPAACRAVADLRLRAQNCRCDRPAALLTAPVLAGRYPVKGGLNLSQRLPFGHCLAGQLPDAPRAGARTH
jgi:hypothetical protein